MPFDYVLFKTDALLYILLVTVTIYAVYASKHKHLSAPWRQVVRGKLSMCAAIILATYLLISILDSIHFHPLLDKPTENNNAVYSTEIISLFDHLVGPLRLQTEKTYSAPFATHLFSKETVESAGAQSSRMYPRLEYGGIHLQNPGEQRFADILKLTISGLLYGLIVWLLLAGMFILFLARNSNTGFWLQTENIIKGKTSVPWHVLFITFGVIIISGFICGHLSMKYHIFGTDKVGIDVFYQSLKGIRTGLLIGTLTTLIMLPFAVTLGVMAGYFRGWIDDVIQYLYTTLSSIPGVLLIAAAALLLEVYMAKHAEDFTNLAARADLRLLFLCMILGVTSWTGLCRLLRGEALKLREIDYIEASRAFGVSHFTILVRHMLPNVMHIVMITIVLDFSGLVLAEAVLSYINIGVDPTMESWGNMINSARLEMAREPVVWWSLVAAFFFMLGLVLSANLFADGVRDAFDPRIRQNIE